ncbi:MULTISPECIES: flavodoxin domain-containing protein [Marinimicrobium]|jgi:MioC protein|uniref:MioC protein n=1 Tax=Marinimicrobium koreense TaxID=306545 RepID=A0A3N1NWT7_9GAMM|nr:MULTISPECIES: flavodoxin domain-containing protein [Marinimicrobium]ROQ20665.1 MioC protein [Marinimicrobium koreense]|tara:strand:+ start:1470 stop:1934 length:465 start_codon:yes stop_codon:yes gene_type:complete
MSQIQILVGSVTGNAEGIAELAAEELQRKGHQISINNFAQVEDLVRSPDEILLICTSNTGAGDLPDNLQPLYVQMTREYPAIAGRQYGLINLGDSSYTTFGEAGQAIDDAFADLGAQRIGEPLVLDACSGDDPEESAREWLEQWATLLPDGAPS